MKNVNDTSYIRYLFFTKQIFFSINNYVNIKSVARYFSEWVGNMTVFIE